MTDAMADRELIQTKERRNERMLEPEVTPQGFQRAHRHVGKEAFQ